MRFMNIAGAAAVAADPCELGVRAKLAYPDAWHHNCHAASVRLLRTGAFGPGRVVRGFCRGVGGQHSWIVLSQDAWDQHATLVDPTLWSYDDRITGIHVTSTSRRRWRPHGSGVIWGSEMPYRHDGDVVHLAPREPLSAEARGFLSLIEPLDLHGWQQLAHSPMGGWPSAEIIAAMDDTPGLRAFIPVDILGMATDRNPGGLYLHLAGADRDPVTTA